MFDTIQVRAWLKLWEFTNQIIIICSRSFWGKIRLFFFLDFKFFVFLWDCNVTPCFELCEDQYGGSFSSGMAYYCAKGCASMSDGQLVDPLKYCPADETT